MYSSQLEPVSRASTVSWIDVVPACYNHSEEASCGPVTTVSSDLSVASTSASFVWAPIALNNLLLFENASSIEFRSGKVVRRVGRTRYLRSTS